MNSIVLSGDTYRRGYFHFPNVTGNVFQKHLSGIACQFLQFFYHIGSLYVFRIAAINISAQRTEPSAPIICRAVLDCGIASEVLCHRYYGIVVHFVNIQIKLKLKQFVKIIDIVLAAFINDPDKKKLSWCLTEPGESKPYIQYVWDNDGIWGNDKIWTANNDILGTDMSNNGREIIKE